MNTQEQFFILLRAGLWDKAADPEDFPENTDWKAIYCLAKQQAVAGVVYEGLSTLPSALQPEPAVLRQWYALIIKLEQSHELLNQQLVWGIQQIQLEGICPVLLKGQGVAQNYPNPRRRHCGDIDLYTGKKDYKRICTSLRKQDIESDSCKANEKRYYFRRNRVAFEIHRFPGHLGRTFLNREFQRWSKQHLESNDLKKTYINGIDVKLPPPNFDALYIFNHAYLHFIFGGIGLRQLCDWLLYLHAFNKEIDMAVLKHDIISFGLLRPWQIFSCIIVNYMGLPEKEIPFYNQRYNIKAKKIVEHILKEGNFGQYIEKTDRPKNYLKGKLHSFKYQQQRIWNLFPLAPKDISIYYIDFIIRGIRQIARELLKTDKIE